MSDLKACIFDLDGVLVDTARYHFIAWQRLAHMLDIEFTEEDNEHLKGVSRVGSLQFILNKGEKEVSPAEFEQLMAKKNTWYLELVEQMKPDETLPNARALLEDLKKNNIKIALGSSSKNARLILEKTHLLPFFDSIVDGTRTTHSKPHPEVFLTAAADLKLQPANCLVFEDARNGIEAALAGNFITIGIGDPEILKRAHYVTPNLQPISYYSLCGMDF